ncbi:MAG: histidine kinase [Salibacteraceae bacterium]
MVALLRWCFMGWWVLLGWHSTAQTVVFERFAMKDGLPSPVVFRVAPHPESGLLWIGTLNGLVSFDGHHFQTYDFSQPILNNMVLSIDHHPGTRSTVAYYQETVFELNDYQLLPVQFEGDDQALFDSASTTFHQMETDRWNRQWFVTISDELFFRDSAHFHSYTWPGGKRLYAYVHQIPEGALYIGTDRGVIRQQADTSTLLFEKQLKGIKVDAMTHDTLGRLWLTGGGQVFYQSGEELVKVFEVEGHAGRSILKRDPKGRIWFLSGYKGLYLLDEKGLLMEVNRHIWEQMPLINDLNFDREGNIWIGTFGDGLYRVWIEENHFRIPFENDPNRPISYVTCTADGQLYVATYGDIYRGDYTGVVSLNLPEIGDDELVFSFLEAPDGGVWVGTASRLGRLTREGVEMIDNEQGCNCMSADQLGGIWCGLFHSFRYIYQDKVIRKPSFDQLNQRVNALVVDQNNLLWIGTPKGLFTFDGDGLYPVKAADATQEFVVRLMVDTQNRLWCSTRNGIRMLEAGKWRSYYPEDGLPHRQCRSFLEDQSGRIWVTTDLGLCYLGADDRFHSVQHCFPEVTRQKITHLALDSEGMILASSNQSVFRLNPNELTPGLAPPLPHLEQVMGGGQRLTLEQPGNLSYTSNNLKVKFSGVSFRYPEYVRCRYRLLGLEEDWQESASNQVDYRSLPPGNYTFELATRFDFQSEWSTIRSYSFSVARPFWLEWWWWTLEVTVGLWLVFQFSRWRVQQARHKEHLRRQVEKQLSDLRQQALAAMMNPHFFANVINSIQDYLHTHRKEEVEDYLTDFAHLVRLNLSLAGETDIPLDEEIHRLEL